MAQVIEVDDASDVRLRDYLALTDVSLRRLLEPANGLFIAESAKVVRRCLDAGYQPRSALLSARWLPEAETILADHDVEVYVVPDDVLAAVTGFQVHRGMLAAMARKPLRPVAELVAGASLVAVLEDLVDHTNVGAVFRSAAAMGVDAVLVSPRCADPLYRRSVRVSMGTVLQVPWTRADPWPESLDLLRSLGFMLLALSPEASGTSLPDVVATGPVAVLIGSEGPGLTPEALARSDAGVRIPMRPGVDSLNAAAASAVAFYALGPGSRVAAGEFA
jgi:tRNA G18 (ribose-2'-O)-methylase SpoU